MPLFRSGKNVSNQADGNPGSLAEITTELDDGIYDLNSLYRSVIMVAGTDPDNYRDYQLSKVIPGFKDTISDLKQRLNRR